MLSKGSRVLLLILAATAAIGSARYLAAQGTEEKAIVSPSATAKFGPIPNAPECFTIAVEKGDPTKGASVILARFAPGCIAPFHWHTPSETVMVVSGSLELQMKEEKALVETHSVSRLPEENGSVREILTDTP